MTDFSKYPYFACVKFELINKEFLRQFNEYMDHHVIDIANKNGRNHGWRTREDRDAPNAGYLNQEFWQIYQIDNPDLFRYSMPKGVYPPRATEHFPFYRDVSRWERTYYRILTFHRSAAEKDAAAGEGRYWARFEFDLNGSHEDEADYLAEYGKEVGNLLQLPGVHQARMLRYETHDMQVGERADAKYMLQLEIDAPEAVFDKEQRKEKPALARILAIRNAQAQGRHFAKLILKAPRGR